MTTREPVGIVGGGQLAQMLIEGSRSLNLGDVANLDESPTAMTSPAALAGGKVETRAADFFARARLVVFENEFVDCDQLAREANGARFVPSLAVLSKLQDKLAQKCALQDLDIATSPFEKAPTGGAVDAWVDWLIWDRFPRGVVLKWAKLGYDGKGVCLLRAGDSRAREKARDFQARARERGVEVFAEELVEFRRELAIIACRSVASGFTAYPLVESQQREGICHWVQGPVNEPALEARARDFAQRLGAGVGLEGTYALEFFENREGELLVNEIAPRVHNTGHYSQDAAETSQFENHWRAVLGQPLGSVRTAPAFAMLNLLGPEGLELDLEGGWAPPGEPGLFVHWYGKTGVRPGRKLGHVNARADDPAELPELRKKLEAWHSRWESALRTLKKEK